MLFTILALLLSLSAFVSAQVGQILDKSKLPSCAFNCQTLTQAQTLCVPPTAPVQDQAVYQTCFCNSNYLVNFKSGITTGVCDAACPSSDLTQIQQWFVGLCNGGAVVTPNNGGSTTATSTGTGSASTSTSSSSSSSSKSSSGSDHKSWLEEHYRWIVMIVVLLIAALVATIIGIWLKRRYARRYALGGHNHGSMLAADEAANTLKDRHPDAPSSVSQVQLPSWDGSVFMSGGASSRDGLPSSRGMEGPPASGTGKGKERIDTAVKDLGPAGSSLASPTSEEAGSGSVGRSSSRLRRKISKRSKR